MGLYLIHYGTPRHSGRYPWGSGKNPQRNLNWYGRVKKLRAKGLSLSDIAKAEGMTLTEFKQQYSISKDEAKAARIAQVIKLKNEKQMSVNAIAKRMGESEATVRGWLKNNQAEKTKITSNISDALKDEVSKKRFIDIGEGTEVALNVTKTKFDTAVRNLVNDGYVKKTVWIGPQNAKRKQKITVLAEPGTTTKDIYENSANIGILTDYTSDDGGRTIRGIKPPVSISSERVKIKYAEDGGTDKDGLIEIKRGIQDLDLGQARYLQARIAVDSTMYMKGMAVYGDDKDFPPGVDVIYNSKKHKGTPKEKVYKEMETNKDGSIDTQNPFGTTIKANGQHEYIDKDGNKHQSAINIVNEEGDWSHWSETLSSQILSKQLPSLAKRQLDLDRKQRVVELEDIDKIQNPIVKKKELIDFANNCDKAAEHLKASKMPGQTNKVILPAPTLKENEVYAPDIKEGTQVALFRHPHAGRFEIAEAVVTHKNKEAERMIGKDSRDAICINPKAASKLSGADFDGDTVIVIPNNQGLIKTQKPIKDLQNFDPIEAYPAYEGMKKVKDDKSFVRNTEMGKISNLITDMTQQNPTEEHLARAVKHSMVVIDAEKHNLDWRRSFDENGIAELKKIYQGGTNKGASTLVSRAGGRYDDLEYKEWKPTKKSIDPETGEKILTYTGREIGGYTKKDGTYVKVKPAKTTTTKMAHYRDAFEIATPSEIDTIYATYANQMKALGNEARKKWLSVENPEKPSKEAKEAYAEERASLLAKLDIAKKNKPLERKAQAETNSYVEAVKKDNPDMEKEEESKIRRQTLDQARRRLGIGEGSSKASKIVFTDKEWEALDAGVFSAAKVQEIIDNANIDSYKKYARPRNTKVISTANKQRALALLNAGFSLADVAETTGISTSTLVKLKNEGI